jgi:hypothetical protein
MKGKCEDCKVRGDIIVALINNTLPNMPGKLQTKGICRINQQHEITKKGENENERRNDDQGY